MNTMDEYVAKCQMWLSVIFLTGYFIVIILFMMGFAKIPTDYKESFSGLLTLMTGGGLTILYFWFQRSRNQPSPDPNTTISTTVSAGPTRAGTNPPPTPSKPAPPPNPPPVEQGREVPIAGI
jgi:hypothetical protein